MNTLKEKWSGLGRPAQIGIAVGAALVTVFFLVKVLPYLITAMGIGLFVALLFVPYWIPTIVAFVRKHPSKGAILALNLLLGWSFVGWVVALVWALGNTNASAAAPTVIVNNTTVAPGVAPQPVYQVGDVVNGHRFDGQSWIPVTAAPDPATHQAPPPPLADQVR